MKKTTFVAAMIMTGLIAMGCASDDNESGDTAGRSADSPYALDQPDTSFVLPEALLEISGLTALDSERLAAVQDEDGIVFVLDGATGAVSAGISFGDGGDYEGIEVAGGRMFVLRSNGNLTEVTGWEQNAPEVRAQKTGLTRKNDTEGLAYDAAGGRVLIVTKQEPGAGLDEEEQKAIYAFDPESGRLADDPALVIELRGIREALPGLIRFNPSALAVHPTSGDIYVLSATEQALVAVDSGGGLRYAWRLQKALFEKPEGLAFSPNGDLFISGEGVEGPPVLFRFTAREVVPAE